MILVVALIVLEHNDVFHGHLKYVNRSLSPHTEVRRSLNTHPLFFLLMVMNKMSTGGWVWLRILIRCSGISVITRLGSKRYQIFEIKLRDPADGNPRTSCSESQELYESRNTTT